MTHPPAKTGHPIATFESMSRARRSFVAGGIYHVFSRGNRKEPVFLSDGDRSLFLDILRKVKSDRTWTLHGYCLMRNHYHLVVETPQPDLSAGMQRINGLYASWFNRSYGFVGHVFQGRFQAVAVESDWHLLELNRYLALNPVRAGLCHAPALWTWGGYAEVVGTKPAALVTVSKVLRVFGADPDRAKALFRRFVEDGLGL
jgi:putative transposase